MLSVCPGLGLLDRAFEAAGFTVVRGPDALWGGDVRAFHVPSGVFVGVIGGPPCQRYSKSRELRTGWDHSLPEAERVDLVPDFVRICEEARPRFVVMENVPPLHGHEAIPHDWTRQVLRDWDCGGLTNRSRSIWTWPFIVLCPPTRPGRAALSVMASTYKRGSSSSQYVKDKSFLPGDLPLAEYARLQGCEEVGEALEAHGFSRQSAVTMLGNGVPFALGSYVARQAMAWLTGAEER